MIEFTGVRRVIGVGLLAGLVLSLAGCGKVANATLVMVPEAATPAAAIISNNAARLTPTETPVATLAPTITLLPGLEAEDDPPTLANAAYEDAPSYQIDDRIPYGVAVVTRMAHSTTIAWRTEVPTRGTIDYGRVWGFGKNGYTGEYTDEIAKTDHQITLTDLRRFTAYQFKVTAITPLGLRFQEPQERKFRTAFWSWR